MKSDYSTEETKLALLRKLIHALLYTHAASSLLLGTHVHTHILHRRRVSSPCHPSSSKKCAPAYPPMDGTTNEVKGGGWKTCVWNLAEKGQGWTRCGWSQGQKGLSQARTNTNRRLEPQLRRDWTIRRIELQLTRRWSERATLQPARRQLQEPPASHLCCA